MRKAGERAPDFSGTTHRGEQVSLGALTAEGPLVLFFYPGDFTTICTKEACHFRDFAGDFQKRSARLLGVSKDGEESHKKFAQAYNLQYDLLSDVDGKIADAYGLKPLLPFMPMKRATFVIETDGTIRSVIHKELNAMAHVEQALKALDAKT